MTSSTYACQKCMQRRARRRGGGGYLAYVCQRGGSTAEAAAGGIAAGAGVARTRAAGGAEEGVREDADVDVCAAAACMQPAVVHTPEADKVTEHRLHAYAWWGALAWTWRQCKCWWNCLCEPTQSRLLVFRWCVSGSGYARGRSSTIPKILEAQKLASRAHFGDALRTRQSTAKSACIGSKPHIRTSAAPRHHQPHHKHK